MTQTPLAALEISTQPDPKASIIWLHGLGADGHDFAPVVQELALTSPVRFILPHAPVRPITINGGHAMPGWYDILTGNLTQQQDVAGIRASQASIETLIEREVQRGIPPGRIMLAGFSQGGAIALQTGLRHAESLAGIIALSTYLPLQESFMAERTACNQGCPIFMGHGLDDTMIALATAKESMQKMARLGYHVEWHEYRMAHSVCLDEITDIRNFIQHRLGR
jgi:phospholipase/carboxylesterase